MLYSCPPISIAVGSSEGQYLSGKSTMSSSKPTLCRAECSLSKGALSPWPSACLYCCVLAQNVLSPTIFPTEESLKVSFFFSPIVLNDLFINEGAISRH